ncbi:MAG: hypothetical protein K6T59_05830, partial [Bryobacteraceae bacterium]|nr:hypothetical protein [Bryobacteraceae bacterium]
VYSFPAPLPGRDLRPRRTTGVFQRQLLEPLDLLGCGLYVALSGVHTSPRFPIGSPGEKLEGPKRPYTGGFA